MPLINIQQGFYGGRHGLPNMQEEWNLYSREFGLNSFAVYAHGEGQGEGNNFVMSDDRNESYSLKEQCRSLMKKLDM